ncbi:MAG: hypothetical protein MK078_09270 [Crocinitomicaceae bacterium]|nr:hypothetical protein [Crocinitomicaceae bacterium]
MSNNRVKKILFSWPVLIITFCVVLFSAKLYENYKENLLLDSLETNAKVIRYSTERGSWAVHYCYYIEDLEYCGLSWIFKNEVDSALIGTEDLRIKYSKSDYSVSTVVDERFN